MLTWKYRLQEGEGNGGGGGGDAAAAAAAAAAAKGGDWRQPFGAEGATAFKDFTQPADMMKAWTAQGTELATLKGKTFDWRKEIGGEDPEAQKVLGRFTEPKAFLKSFNDAQALIRSGTLAKPLDMAKATPEQIAEWRTANGVPLEVKGYFEKLPNGMVIGKTDQAAFDRYGKIWHDFNIPPTAAHAMAQAYYADQDAVAKAERKLDDDQRLKVTQELRTLWGNDFDANENTVSSFLDGLGKEGKASLMDAVLPTGERLWNNREFREWIAKSARENNPLAHLIPGNGEGDLKSLESELAGLKKLMGDKNSAYWKGPTSAKNQQRYRDLITAQQQVNKRVA